MFLFTWTDLPESNKWWWWWWYSCRGFDVNYVLFVVAMSTVTLAPDARFTYCPPNVTMVTNMERVAVWWRNPVVDVIVSSPPVLVSHTLPGGTFTTGLTSVLYKTLSADGVATYCQFYVDVVMLGLSVFRTLFTAKLSCHINTFTRHLLRTLCGNLLRHTATPL